MNINWMALTNNLRRDYKSLSTVAKEIGADWQHLNRLARGEVMCPRFDTGMKLLDLHYDKCRSKHLALLNMD